MQYYARSVPIVLVLLLFGCTSVVEQEAYPLCADTFEPKPSEYHVIGFYPAWKHNVTTVSQIRWDLFTRVIYAFAIPRSDGSLDVTQLTQVDTLVAAAHAHGVEVYLSVGGGSGSEQFPVLAADGEARRNFVQSISEYLEAHCLDGVDIDWEHWAKDNANAPVASEQAGFVLSLIHI